MYMLLCCREEAQKCYCGSANCRGILGGPPPKDNRRPGLYANRLLVQVRTYVYECGHLRVLVCRRVWHPAGKKEEGGSHCGYT